MRFRSAGFSDQRYNSIVVSERFPSAPVGKNSPFRYPYQPTFPPAAVSVVVRHAEPRRSRFARRRRGCRPAGARDRCRPCSCSTWPPGRTPQGRLATRSCEVHHPGCSSRIFRRTTFLPIRRRSSRRARCWKENFRRWLPRDRATRRRTRAPISCTWLRASARYA